MPETWTRNPRFAGSFYSADPNELRSNLQAHLVPAVEPQQAFAILSPHAGYMYSGAIAGEVFRRVKVPDRVFILCPNHTGLGEQVSVWAQGEWNTPLGSSKVDAEACRRLLDRIGVTEDREAHLEEHAIEVQLPFVQMRNPAAEIVPVVLGGLSLSQCRQIGRLLRDTIDSLEGDSLIVASTDMSHFVSASKAKEQDQLALESFKHLDADSLYQTVVTENISMCGFVPTTATIFAANANDDRRVAEILSYGNSGDTNEDYERVVGYASGWIQ